MKEGKVQRCICIRERKEEKQSGKQGKRFIKEGDTEEWYMVGVN